MADSSADIVKVEGTEVAQNLGTLNFSTGLNATADNNEVTITLREGWEDLRFAATAINLIGAAADPTLSSTTGLLEFSKTAQNTVVIVGQMPHSWKLGSTISPHIHVLYDDANTGDSVWKLEYKIAGINDQFPADFTADTQTFAAPGVIRTHKLHPFTDIDMSAIDGVSAMFIIKLSRMGGDGSDDYDNAISFLEFDIHYQMDTHGSAQETSKTIV